MTVPNLRYLVRQREAFERLSPPPDFPDAGGKGESGFTGHGTETDFASTEGMRAAGCGSMKWNVADAVSDAERALIEKANEIVFD
ncbi:hypothetical protein V1523DRAFT_449185 [Lipomyces doorenjongii]